MVDVVRLCQHHSAICTITDKRPTRLDADPARAHSAYLSFRSIIRSLAATHAAQNSGRHSELICKQQRGVDGGSNERLRSSRLRLMACAKRGVESPPEPRGKLATCHGGVAAAYLGMASSLMLLRKRPEIRLHDASCCCCCCCGAVLHLLEQRTGIPLSSFISLSLLPPVFIVLLAIRDCAR
jgi:hypothetical protein